MWTWAWRAAVLAAHNGETSMTSTAHNARAHTVCERLSTLLCQCEHLYICIPTPAHTLDPHASSAPLPLPPPHTRTDTHAGRRRQRWWCRVKAARPERPCVFPQAGPCNARCSGCLRRAVRGLALMYRIRRYLGHAKKCVCVWGGGVGGWPLHCDMCAAVDAYVARKEV